MTTGYNMKFYLLLYFFTFMRLTLNIFFYGSAEFSCMRFEEYTFRRYSMWLFAYIAKYFDQEIKCQSHFLCIVKIIFRLEDLIEIQRRLFKKIWKMFAYSVISFVCIKSSGMLKICNILKWKGSILKNIKYEDFSGRFQIF